MRACVSACGWMRAHTVWPMAVHVGAQRRARRGEGPAALVLAPTRELAIQIAVEAQKLLWGSRLFASVVYGGASARAQLAEVGP